MSPDLSMSAVSPGPLLSWALRMVWELQSRPMTGGGGFLVLLYRSVGGRALCLWGWQMGLLGMHKPAGLQVPGVEYGLHV